MNLSGRRPVCRAVAAVIAGVCALSAMADDECSQAVAIAGEGQFAFDNTLATTGLDQPPTCRVPRTINNDIWFCWTAPVNGRATLSTIGLTTLDTVVAAYDGCACPPTMLLDCNDDTSGLQSEIYFDVTAGSSYAIQVGTFGTTQFGTGSFDVSIDPAGACCFNDGACVQLASSSCTGQGGTFNGAGVDCGSVVCDNLFADDTPVPLNYNWNGIVHGAAEQNDPDNPNGFRSVADRALLFADQAPFDLQGARFRFLFIDQAGLPDLVYLGNRNVVGVGCNCPFDAVADGDNIGTQPNWLPDALVTTATTPISPGLPLNTTSRIALLYNYTNGGGTFNMTLHFSNGSSVPLTLEGPDWFANNNGAPAAPGAGVESQALLGGTLSGGDGFPAADRHDTGQAGAPLNLVEAVASRERILIDLGIDVAGLTLDAVTFDARSSDQGNVAIYALTVETADGPVGCACELDGVAGVDVFDLLSFLDLWFASAAGADIDGVPGVDVFDLLFFLDCWFPASAGAPCP